MKESNKNKIKVVTIISLVAVLVLVLFNKININNSNNKAYSNELSSKKVSSKNTTKLMNEDNSLPHGTNQWKYPSEDKPYPVISNYNNINIIVSLNKQRVYIKNGNDTLYTMYCSSGIHNSTPKGTFTICNRGNNFYNNNLNEGANYWTSFTNDNVYLFHSVPTMSDGNYNIKESQKLGKPASHGCIRLSVPDAEWINDNIPNGTKVVIK